MPIPMPDGFDAEVLADTARRVYKGSRELYRTTMFSAQGYEGMTIVVNPERRDRCRLGAMNTVGTVAAIEETPEGPRMFGIPVVADSHLGFAEIRFRSEVTIP